MSKKRISKEKSIKHAKTTTEVVISLVLLGTCGFFAKSAFTDVTRVEQSTFYDNRDIASTDTTATTTPDPNQIIYESRQVESKSKFYGDLILINKDHEYFSSHNEDLVSIIEMNQENERTCFTAVDSTYTILKQVYVPMANMIQDFYDETQNDTLIIYGSYRTNDFQRELYQADLDKTGEDESESVAPPGYSEHESGLAFDFSETTNYDYDGKGDFEWLNKNCYKYGFVVRYTKDKEAITKFKDEPWHFRYVGIPHAYYMNSNDLCLEEYIDLIRKHPYEGEHLEFSEGTNDYEVYFVPSDDGAENTTVPVPNGVRYEISGNNVDGFIVTVYKGQKPLVEETPTKAFEEAPELTSASEEVETSELSEENE
jgi:D-alanyl-D-alanine carboxypeptidase